MAAARPRPRGGSKPRDAGTGVVCASLTGRGWWLSLATIDPRDGFVELTGMPAFDERARGDPGAVRRYRALMADPSSAFLRLEPTAGAVLTARLLRRAGEPRLLEQRLTLRRRAGTDGPVRLGLRFGGRLDLPPLAMITEPRALVAPRSRHATAVSGSGAVLRVSAVGLATTVAIELAGAPEGSGWQVAGDGSALFEVELAPSERERLLRLRCRIDAGGPRIGDGGRRRRSPVAPVAQLAPLEGPCLPADLVAPLDAMRRRALRYVRECAALRVAADRVVLLTDHRLLPLSWTRDAYYQALLLLRHGEHELVADHLRWLWLDCRRPAATWARSHHADGRRHDDVYQADQQLYPLLELADYRAYTGRLPAIDGAAGDEPAWAEMAGTVLDDLARKLAEQGLLPSDENAADDPIAMPYVLANQLLASHALARLAGWPALDGRAAAPAAMAETIRSAIGRHFGAGGPSAPWPYAVDGRGGSVLFHDANDVPTALAPLLGFCRADDPRWRATIEFAFSPANEAWAAGPFGGLGSRHTPGVWPLGLIQEWIAFSLAGERRRAEAALRRLVACAFADGMLPEASDPLTGRPTARHWFAWPGALLGALAAGAPTPR